MVLAVPLIVRADDAWAKRLEAAVAQLEAAVKKVDGKSAPTGTVAARLAALDARVADLEVKAGRSRGSETIPSTGDLMVLLGKWTNVLTHLSSRFQDTQRPSKPNTKGDGTPTPDPSTLVASGTGFFITADGELATCAHVIQAGKSYRIATETGQYAATVVKVDKDRDLAILRVKGTFAPIPICPSADIRLGAMVGTVGYPNPELQGKSPKATKGEISSLTGLKDDEHAFQVSLPIQPGNSGGALFDARGNVVGIVAATLNQDVAKLSSGASAQNVNYAIKSAYLLNLIASIPGLKERLPASCAEEQKFEDVVAIAQKATGMVLVYNSTPESLTGPSLSPGGQALPTTIEELDLFPEKFVGRLYFVDHVWMDGDIDRWNEFVLLRLTSLKGKSTVNVPRKDGIVFALSKGLAQKLLAFGFSADTRYLGRVRFEVSPVNGDWIATVRELSVYAKNGSVLKTFTE